MTQRDGQQPPVEATPPPLPSQRRAWFGDMPPHIPGQATRGQRVALGIGLLIVAWLALQLFQSVLAPFVAAAGIAYVLDPPTTRLTRLGLSRGIAALLMIIGLLAAVLLFALLLYPLILQQIGQLIGRIPQYVAARSSAGPARCSPTCSTTSATTWSTTSCVTWSAARPATC